MKAAILTVVMAGEPDVVLARRRAREVAELLGFDAGDQTRIATAVSEIARNAFQFAGSGRVEFHLEGTMAPQLLVVRVSDRGRGIRNVEGTLAGSVSHLGIVGARRLVDRFEIESSPSGTVVVLKKILPSTVPYRPPARLQEVAADLLTRAPSGPYEELQRQNQELLQALDQVRRHQEELALLNSELEDTNRGVLALYAELDEKADHLRRADELKSRFLSNMSHEFRTPLNSITALTGLLLGRTDGDLNEEQEQQIRLMRKAAQELSELVNDLLDLAKVEAGKIVVRPSEFDVSGLFAALRGMLRPLLVSDRVSLLFEDPGGVPPLTTDEAKVSQILRNFLSNAIKFTERGEIRVTATWDPGTDMVIFRVSDTGIGIAQADQQRIFEEFGQLDNPVQKKVKGTGLGLPLTRRLAHLLGGSAWVESEPGVGSSFYASIPASYSAPEPAMLPPPVEADPALIPILVVEDSPETLLTYEKYLKRSAFQIIPARNAAEARAMLRRHPPAAVILDILLPGEDGWGLLAEIKTNPETDGVPVVVVTSTEDERKVYALGADAYFHKPVGRAALLARLTELTAKGRAPALIVDDDETFRYLLRRSIGARLVLEARDGLEGLRMAREFAPAIVFLDLSMPEMTGQQVLEALRADPATASLPVVIVTAKTLGAAERAELGSRVVGIIPKDEVSPQRIGHAMEQAAEAAGAREIDNGGT